MNLRIYVATQIGCEPCQKTLEALGEKVEGVPVYEVDLSSSPERRRSMGVSKTPTIFIVGGKDEDDNGIWEEKEEKLIWRQSGMVLDKSDLSFKIRAIKDGQKLYTPIS